MSNSVIRALLAGLVFAMAAGLKAEDLFKTPLDPELPAPQPPYLKEPDSIAYTATFSYAHPWPKAATPEEIEKLSQLKKMNPRVKTLEVDKIGELRRDVCDWDEDEGRQTASWYSQTAAFKKMLGPDGKVLGIYSEPAFEKKSQAFPELHWVGRETYDGAFQLENKKVVDVYRITVTEPTGFAPMWFNHEQVVAYVDDATRLPIALKTGDFTVVYSYRTPPANLNPPEEYLKAFNDYRAAKAQVYKVP